MCSTEGGVRTVKIGPFIITRVRRNKTGLKIYPWQALTEDRVEPELRQIIAKVARSEAKTHLAELAERSQEDDRTREFIRCELERYAAGYFPIDQATFVDLMRLLDRLRSLQYAHQNKEPDKVCVSSHCVENQHVLMDPTEDA